MRAAAILGLGSSRRDLASGLLVSNWTGLRAVHGQGRWAGICIDSCNRCRRWERR